MKHMLWAINKIAVLGTIVCAGLYFFNRNQYLLSLLITLSVILYHFSMRLIVGACFDRWMHNKVDYTKAWYQPRRWEAGCYHFLRVKQWKRKLPTYDPEQFDYRLHSAEEIVQAMCQAELVHETIAVFSFVPLLAIPWAGAAPVFAITSILAACIDLSFAAIQRYNRPRLMKLMRREGRNV